MTKIKKVKSSNSKLVALTNGSHKIDGHKYTWNAGDEVEVKGEHLETVKSLPAFKE